MKPLFHAVFAASFMFSTHLSADASGSHHSPSQASSHAPIGVMGDHLHKKGEFMFSYRYMNMDMQGNLDGSQNLSPEQIASTVPNRFANNPMQPPTLRVVPIQMNMEMHMLGMMYAPSNKFTLMAMTNYQQRTMDHITFMGAMGTTRLGTFTTQSNGIGDTSLSALIKINHLWHATAGLSLPTGSIKETDAILTPMNTRPSPRLPYPMQLGSGTYDVIGGLTYASSHDQWGWGSQWHSTFRTGENSENYTLGDEHKLSTWLSYSFSDVLSVSSRIQYLNRGNIDGIDSQIVAPVQTADPNNQGIDRWDFNVGANWLLPGNKHRLALELSAPISQNLDGPQLETDFIFTIGWQYAP